jgi:hypothetical protein
MEYLAQVKFRRKARSLTLSGVLHFAL